MRILAIAVCLASGSVLATPPTRLPPVVATEPIRQVGSPTRPELVFSFVPQADAELEAEFRLPKGLVAVGKATPWKGMGKKGERVEMRLRVRPTRVGYTSVTACVTATGIDASLGRVRFVTVGTAHYSPTACTRADVELSRRGVLLDAAPPVHAWGWSESAAVRELDSLHGRANPFETIVSFETQLRIVGTPRKGGRVDAVFRVNRPIDRSANSKQVKDQGPVSTLLRIILPPRGVRPLRARLPRDFEDVSFEATPGLVERRWVGPIEFGETVQLTLPIEILEDGYGSIDATVSTEVGRYQYWLGALSRAYLWVCPYEGAWDSKPIDLVARPLFEGYRTVPAPTHARQGLGGIGGLGQVGGY